MPVIRESLNMHDVNGVIAITNIDVGRSDVEKDPVILLDSKASDFLIRRRDPWQRIFIRNSRLLANIHTVYTLERWVKS
jgi:hypothetical protein